MPPPSLPMPRSASMPKDKSKRKEEDAMDEDVIEFIDSDDDEPRKRPLG